jgi:hypothetical protein
MYYELPSSQVTEITIKTISMHFSIKNSIFWKNYNSLSSQKMRIYVFRKWVHRYKYIETSVSQKQLKATYTINNILSEDNIKFSCDCKFVIKVSPRRPFLEEKRQIWRGKSCEACASKFALVCIGVQLCLPLWKRNRFQWRQHILWNIGIYLQDYTVSQSWTPHSEVPIQWR